jgi:putative Holliday junction resolvase
MRWLGVDLGARRVGLAVSEDDEGPAVASRTATIEPGGELAAVVIAAKEERADVVVLGLPIEMSGREGLAARRVRAIGDAIAEALPSVRVAFVDERLTTREASAQLRASGKRAGGVKAAVDSVAAKILLDTQLGIEARRRAP